MKGSLLVLMLALTLSPAYAQNYQINTDSSEVIIAGTSTLHDWESVAEEFTGDADMTIENGQVSEIRFLHFKVKVDEIKSGKRGMDKKTYGALDEKNNPEIVFELGEITSMTADSITASGDLTIAGVRKPVDLTVAYTVHEDGLVRFTGAKLINMEDFEIKPPSAVFGTIKAGAEVTVRFDALFKS